VLVAFAVWCASVVIEVGRLRNDLEAHVAWLRTVDEAEAALSGSRAPGPARTAGDQLLRLADELARDRKPSDHLLLQLRGAGAGLAEVAAARASGEATSQLESEVHERLSELTPTIRTETSTLSVELRSHWQAMFVVAGGAIALAFGMLGMLAYLRLVVMPRVDSDSDRLHRLAHRLAQFDRAAHGVAHELNSPLTAIVTNLQLLAERMRAAPPVAAATSNIYLIEDALQGLAKVSGTVQDLRSPSASGESSAFDPNAVVDAALSTTRFRVGDSVTVALSLNRVPLARAPDGLVQRLVEELLIGAFLVEKSDDTGGESIAVKTIEAGESHVAIELDLPHRALAGIELRDFERRMKALGGQFVTTPRGARVLARFELPSERAPQPPSEGQVPAADAPPPAPDAPAADRLAILLVDDDDLVRTSVRRVLAKHDVTTESDGDSAIAKIVEGDYDLVLCDLMMPGKSGMEVYNEVVARRPELAERFVFISGGASTAEAERFLEEHATERLDKPFGMESLRRLVADAAKRRKKA
jgi:CheY-like chemotaxis protein